MKVDKLEFYQKLLKKLQKIKDNKMTLDEYIEEVVEKIEDLEDGEKVEMRIENGRTNIYKGGKMIGAQG